MPTMTAMFTKTPAAAGISTATGAGAVSRMIRQRNRSIRSNGLGRPVTNDLLHPHGARRAGEMGEVGIAAAVAEGGPEAAAGTAEVLAEEGLAEGTAGEAADLAVSEEAEASVVVRNNHNSALWAFIVEIVRRRA